MTISEFREKFFALIEESEQVVITSHMNPDDDSIGSVMYAWQILNLRYPQKNIRIIYSGEPVERYSVFDVYKKIEWVDDIANHLKNIDLMLVLDVNNRNRFSKFPENILDTKTVVIDHHSSKPDEFALIYIDPEFSSNSELTYRILGEDIELTKGMAESVLLGIVGDTGNFSYINPNQTEVLILAETLIKKVGVSIDAFRSRYMGIPPNLIPLLQELVKNITYQNINNWPPFQYSYITREAFENGGYTDEDMSAASHIYIGQYLPKVRGYTWGFVITPRTDNTCRMSARSLPESVNVRDLHERMEIGGGHDRAAGGYLKDSDPIKCVAKVLEWMKHNHPILN